MRCDALHTKALSRQSSLDEALLKLGRFEEAYSDFKGWLARTHNQLRNPEPIPGQSTSVAVLTTKHKVNLSSFLFLKWHAICCDVAAQSKPLSSWYFGTCMHMIVLTACVHVAR